MTALEVKKTSTKSFLEEFKGSVCIKCSSQFVREIVEDGKKYYHCVNCDRVFELHPIKGMVEVNY